MTLSKQFLAWFAIGLVIFLIVGSYAGYKVYQHQRRVADCAATGGTSYGHDDWLCVR